MKDIIKPTNTLSEYLNEQMYVKVEISGRKAFISKTLDVDLLNMIQKNEIGIDLKNERETIKTILWNLLIDDGRFTREEFWSIKDVEMEKVLTEIVKEYTVLGTSNNKKQYTTFLTNLKLNIDYLKQLQETKNNDFLIKLNDMSTSIFKDKSDFENFQRAFNNFLEVLKNNNTYDEFIKIAEQPKKARKIMISNDWYFDIKYIEQIKEDVIKLESNSDELDRYMIRLIDDEFIPYLDDWRYDLILGKRMPIINQCIESLKHEQYYVFICTLFTQLEGIIVEAFKNYTPENNTTTFKYIKDCVLYMEENNQSEDLSFYDFFCKTILQNFYIGSDCLELNRNSILHGYNISYGTKTNAYKLLAILIYVCDNLEFFSYIE